MCRCLLRERFSRWAPNLDRYVFGIRYAEVRYLSLPSDVKQTKFLVGQGSRQARARVSKLSSACKGRRERLLLWAARSCLLVMCRIEYTSLRDQDNFIY